MRYIGRFAPSPSGPLHFGSLVTALGSYFQARANDGTWLVRIEDIDPPREVNGATQQILAALKAYHLDWDGEVLYQSQRVNAYQALIEEWLSSGKAYYCQCSRKEIKASGGYYKGTCRNKQNLSAPNSSVRVIIDHPIHSFNDLHRGKLDIPAPLAQEDFIIKRRDGLFAYNLAVVLDDIAQQVTEVVRGADLIEPTGRQICLYKMLGVQPINYLHLPLAVDEQGNKLSKQNSAQAIDIYQPKPTLLLAMSFLGFKIPAHIQTKDIASIIDWGCQNWKVTQLPKQIEITSPFSNAFS